MKKGRTTVQLSREIEQKGRSFMLFAPSTEKKNSTSRAFFSAGAAWSLIRECAQLGRIRVLCFLSASR